MTDTLYCTACGYGAPANTFRDLIELDGSIVGIQWQCPECHIWSEQIEDVLTVTPPEGRQ